MTNHKPYIQPSPKAIQRTDFLCGLLPVIVLFVLIPLALFLPNQHELNQDLRFLVPFLAGGVLLAAALWAILKKASPQLASILFYIGMFLLANDLLAPLNMDPLLVGGMPDPPTLLQTISLTLALAACVAAFFLIPWARMRSFGAAFTVILLVLQVFNGLQAWEFPGRNAQRASSSSPAQRSHNQNFPNIYHFTFDGFCSATSKDILQQPETKRAFDGFVFFKNNLANYLYTSLSMPSYMSGQLFKGSSLKHWVDSHRSTGIPSALKKAGYTMDVCVPYAWWIHDQADQAIHYANVLTHDQWRSSMCRFSDFWMVRSAPAVLRRALYADPPDVPPMGPFTLVFLKYRGWAAHDARPTASMQTFNTLLEQEHSRPDSGQYVYAHLYIPHFPHVFTADCAYCPEESDFYSQSQCAVLMMERFVSLLKEQDKFNNSLIIFQSDHGMECFCSSRPDTLALGKEILAPNLRDLSPDAFLDFAQAALLIKPPGKGALPLEISSRFTQLADIPATIYDLARVPGDPGDGKSVFAESFPSQRPVEVFAGWQQKSPSGNIRTWGKNLFKGHLNRFSFIPGKGWSKHPDLPVSWE